MSTTLQTLPHSRRQRVGKRYFILVKGYLIAGIYISLAACSKSKSGDPGPASAASTTRSVVYAVGSGSDSKYYSIAPEAGATPVLLDTIFAKLSPGHDEKLGISADGNWAIVDTTRFDCTDYACLARIRSNGSEGEKILISDEPQHVYASPPAISADGSQIIFTQQDESTGKIHLVITKKTASGWSSLTRLTGSSSYAYHRYPSISPSGLLVAFDCANDSDESTGNSICEVRTDGSGFKTLLSPQDGPGAGRNLHHPSFTPDGSIVFEGEWAAGEQIWHLAIDSKSPTLVQEKFTNDNTPCVLPNGKIASLWLGRTSNSPGYHELKLMDADGTNELMLVIGQDIADIGLACGG